jgi:hypothetical protein
MNSTAKSKVDKEKQDDEIGTSVDMSVLAFGGDRYHEFAQHVDGVFKQAITTYYGRFVSLTEPIISQTTICGLVDLFKTEFPNQYTALLILLNYEEHKKQPDRDHLKQFYDRMIFYQFMSMCRVCCHKTFTW